MPTYNNVIWTSVQPDNGPWKVCQLRTGPGNWYIVNTETGATKKIGRVSRGRGVNYFDRAVAEAERRNDALKTGG